MLPPISPRFFAPDANILLRHRRAQSKSGDAQRLRDAAALRRRERSHHARAATQRLRRRLSPKSNLLRRAQPSQRRKRGGEKMARQNIDAFLEADVDAVIVNAAGCGAAMKEYDHLLRDDPLYAEKAKRFASIVKDAAQFLADLGLVGKLAPLEDVGDLSGPLSSRARPTRTQPAAKFVESDSGTQMQGNGRLGSLLRQRRDIQHHPSRDVAASPQRENAIRGRNSSRSCCRAQSGLHAPTPVRIATIRTRGESLSPHGSPRPRL